jgi:CheY-like chemotaxis protein
MDGYEVAERIRRVATPQEPRVLVLSSAPGPIDADRAKRLGIVRQLSKPLRRSSLLQAIQEAFGVAPPSPRLGGNAALSTANAARPLSLLLVEDNLVNQKLARRLLEKMGHQVALAVNGQQAIEAVRSQGFDLVLMDIQMPVLSGVDATRAIREWEKLSGRHTPIVAMTAHAMTGDAEKFLEAGMDGYVSKPVEIGILRAEIDRLTHNGEPPVNPSKSAVTAVINLQELLDRVDNDRELLLELLSIFKEEFPGNLRNLRAAVTARDLSAVAKLSHTLKGTLSNLAVTAGAASAADLEQAARSGDSARVTAAFTYFEKSVEGLLSGFEACMAEALRS